MAKSKNILFVYPKTPETTYWSYEYAMPFIDKKATISPLGPITVAAMLPKEYSVKLIDMNIEDLKDEDIKKADAVFTSTMVVQKDSLEEVVNQVRRFEKPIVAGGPFPTQFYDKIEGIDHFVLGEAESGALDAFIRDFENGNAKKAYARFAFRKKGDEKEADEREFEALKKFFGENSDIQKVSSRPDISNNPVPRFDLLKMDEYVSIAIQYSRGCPHSCDFCSESTLYGHKMRLKGSKKIISELKKIYDLGFRGSIFVVDDDFIGNKKQVKEDLVDIKKFQEDRRYPFPLYTEATILLAKDKELMRRMRDAGFNMVFVGIETPDKEVLKDMGKSQNVKSDLLEDVKAIQRYGMEVSGGFIVGNDNDPPDICDKVFEFCQEAGIPTAMVGLLTAFKGSPLLDRLKAEGRLRKDSEGDNTHSFELNFKPVEGKNEAKIIGDYKTLLNKLYDRTGKNYYARCSTLLNNLGYNPKGARDVNANELRALFRSARRSMFNPNYSKFMAHALVRHTSVFPEAVRMAIMGYHLRKITKLSLKADEISGVLKMYDNIVHEGGEVIDSIGKVLSKMKRKIQRLPEAYRSKPNEIYGRIMEKNSKR